MSTAARDGTKHFDNIVIGAGISGLACAGRLLQHADKVGSVAVLEARDRIGGRIGSVYVNGNRLDIGANWIHGTGTEDRPNPLMEILPHKRYRELSHMVAFQPPPNSEPSDPASTTDTKDDEWQHVQRRTDIATKANPSQSDLIIPPHAAAIIMGTVWASIEALHEVAENTSPTEAKQTTMLSALGKIDVFRDAFEELPQEYHKALAGLPQFMESMEAAPLAAQSAENAQDSPGMSLLEHAIADFDGEQVFLQDGYIAIINELAKELTKDDAIKTRVEVQKISWDSNPISIETSGGTYTAKNLVCTLPLGVLKQSQAQHRTALEPSKPALFEPSLPRDKIEAITSLGFGTLDKIFLVYSHPWWTEEPYAAVLKKGMSRRPSASQPAEAEAKGAALEPDSLMGFTTELPGIEVNADGNVTSGVRLLSIVNLNALSGFPVLCAFTSCANAVHIESLSDADAGAIVHRALTSWLGREPPQPDAVHVTRWANDPYSIGSYSHMITGLSESKHREIFQKPLTNRKGTTIRFGGEHSSLQHFATAHGALLSGWREADALLEAS